MAKLTKREQDRRAQYMFVAGHAIEGCRLQRRRITSGQSAPRHDLDFYVMQLWRLHEIARLVGNRCGEPLAGEADERFLAEVPELRRLRNWLVHPPDPGALGWVSWFEQDIVQLLPNGDVTFLIDVEQTQSAAERLYENLCSILEPPTETSAQEPET